MCIVFNIYTLSTNYTNFTLKLIAVNIMIVSKPMIFLVVNWAIKYYPHLQHVFIKCYECTYKLNLLYFLLIKKFDCLIICYRLQLWQVKLVNYIPFLIFSSVLCWNMLYYTLIFCILVFQHFLRTLRKIYSCQDLITTHKVSNIIFFW